VVRVSWPVLEFYTPCKISATAKARDFKFCTWVGHAKSLSCDEWVFTKWAWSWSHEQFLHCGLRKFGHSKAPVYRWYTQLDRRQFVYDTYKTMKATQSRHGWVHMSITHCLQLNLQLHNFDLFRSQDLSALLGGNWQDFNRHDASRGPSAIADLLVSSIYETVSLCGCQHKKNSLTALNTEVSIEVVHGSLRHTLTLKSKGQRMGYGWGGWE